MNQEEEDEENPNADGTGMQISSNERAPTKPSSKPSSNPSSRANWTHSQHASGEKMYPPMAQ